MRSHRAVLILFVPYRLQMQPINLPRVVPVCWVSSLLAPKRGHCSQDQPLVLPEGWSVLNIDGQKGCVQLAENGKAQDLLCIA